MTKKKGGKLGAPDHFTGLKNEFLESKSALFQESIDSKAVTTFYDDVTVDFIRTFGCEEPFNKEPPDGFVAPEDDVDDPSTILSEEAAAEKAALFTKLRTVSRKLSTSLLHSDLSIETCTVV